MGAQKIFFSYSRDDSEFVLKLAKDLRAADVNVWLDQLDISAGSQWDTSIQKALRGAECMIVVLSPSSVTSTNVMDEVSYALDEGKRVVPVILKSCEVPFRIRRLQHIDFTGDYKLGLDRLLTALNQGVEQKPIDTSKRELQDSKANRTSTLIGKLASAKWMISALVLGGVLIAAFKLMQSSGSEASQSSREDEVGTQSVEPQEPLTDEQPSKEPTEQAQASPAQESRSEAEPVSSATVTPAENSAPIRGRINLLAPENGGHIVVASGDAWLGTIDGKEGDQTIYFPGEVVYAFKDERMALFDMFTMLIPDTKDQNIKEFELLVTKGDTPGMFQSIVKFQTKNMKLFKTPYQEFSFRKTKAKYLKYKPISQWGGSSYAYHHEFQLFGKLP